MSAANPSLDVYLHGLPAGRLERQPGARLRFQYSPEWVEGGGSPISLALPVRAEAFSHSECGPFFEGLLPEGDFLRALARALHVSAGNPFALLTEIGGECAGAISLGPVGGGAPGTSSPPPRWLGERELEELLEILPERPLALLRQADEDDGVRISLAGAHDKIGVLAEEDRIGITLGAPASTHILKLPITRVSSPIANEAYCMRLAAAAGLNAAEVEPRAAGPHEFLLVRRCDRDPRAEPDGRLNQEDFCQALRVPPEEKYEGEGGPGVAECGVLIRESSSAPVRDLNAFLDALMFNFLIGNNDAHAKNHSLLLDGPEAVRLAPLYDLICTEVFDGTRKKLAMKYGGENKPLYLRRRHLDRLAESLNAAPRLVTRRAPGLIAAVSEAREPARRALPEAFAEQPLLDDVEALIAARCERLAKIVAEPA